MRYRVLCAWALAGVVAAPSAVADDRADAEAAFGAFQAAVRTRDAAAVERVTDPAYVFLHGFGEVDTRDVFLAKMRAGRLARQTAEVTEYEPQVRVVGDTAIRTWVIRFRRPAENIEDWARGSGVLVRRDGAWRMVHQQTSSLYIGPMRPAQPLGGYAGRYEGPRRRFTLTERGDYLHLLYDDGVEAYAFPAGDGVFGMGGGMTLHLEKDAAGRPVRAVRRLGERELWRSDRVG